jgi:hypothetical protein
MPSPRLLAAAALAASLGFAPPARSQECGRPTDPQGYNGFSYDEAPVNSLAGEHVRVWYALSGPHAPALASGRPDDVPDNVARAVAVGDGALERYAGMGFRLPPSDGALPAPCSNGGDGLLDVYLVHFSAGADGTTAVENCVESGPVFTCSSFVLLESLLEARSHYGTFDLGVRTVLPHELFHAVQNAYDEALDRYWAEGTAQWAADALDPPLTDLEDFLPAFFSDPGRPIDLPGGGAVAGFLYASAVWPVFLSRRHGDAIVREALEHEARNGGRAAEAVDGALTARGSSLAAEFPLFASWNAATGSRADPDGYPDAASYPEVPTEELAAGVEQAGLLAGLSAAYYSFHAETRHRVTFAPADPSRLTARLVPLEGGKALLEDARDLPAEIEGDAIVVVAGKGSLKTDASFVLASEAVPDAPPPPAGNPTGGGPTLNVADAQSDDGCAISPASFGARPGPGFGALIGLGLALGAARRKRAVATSGGCRPPFFWP